MGFDKVVALARERKPMPDLAARIDIMWIVLCTALVLFMQAGFCCLESGMIRSKNSINVAIKNLTDFCTAALVFWAF